MIGFPFFHALKRERVIWVSPTFFVNISAHQRQDHLLQLDLIDCAQSFDEMGGWIDVRSPLSDVGENLRKKSFSGGAGLLVVPINGLALFVRKTGPMRNTRREFVSQIDKFFLTENFLNRNERSVPLFLSPRAEQRARGQ